MQGGGEGGKHRSWCCGHEVAGRSFSLETLGQGPRVPGGLVTTARRPSDRPWLGRI